MNLKNLLWVGLSALLVGTAYAGPAYDKMVVEPHGFCDHYESLLDLAKIYEGDGLVNSFALTGRYQGQMFHNSSDEDSATPFDDNDTDWFNRRFRLGWKAKLLNSFTFAAEFDLDTTWDNNDSRIPDAGGNVVPSPGDEGFFQSLDFVELEWQINDRISMNIGKIDPKVTLEDATSSKRILTLERSSVSEMVNHDKSAGIGFDIADVLGNDFRFGVYNDGSGEKWDLPQLNGRYGYEFKINRDIYTAATGPKAPPSLIQNVRMGVWYFHAEDADAEYLDRVASGLDSHFEEFSDVWSINTSTAASFGGMHTDLIIANRDQNIDGDGDYTGLVLMPFIDVSDRVQLVYRYSRAWGENTAGVNPIDLDSALGTGNEFEADSLESHYWGLNYYICGHKLKLMNGIQWTNIEQDGGAGRDREYWSYQSGIRMYF